VHPDLIFKNVSGGEVNATAVGIDEFRELADRSKAMFSSRQQTVTSFASSGDSATVEIQYEGILAVDLPNGMKVGDEIHLNGRSEFEFKDGKLYRIADYS
jgi:hypothetical protein